MKRCLLSIVVLAGGVLLGMYIEQQRTGKFFPDEAVVSFGDDTDMPVDGRIYYDSDGDVLKYYIPSEPTIDGLLDAIEWVESRGGHSITADIPAEVGPYQITKQYVDDVNRIIQVLSMNIPYFTYEDRWDRSSSREMFKILTGYYWDKILIISEDLRFEVLARIHNSGPDGWRNDPRWFVRNRGYTFEEAVTKINNSIAYWELVKNAMEAGGEL